MTDLGLVVAEFNRDLTSEMEEIALSAAEDADAEVVEVAHVPGTYDMPLAVKRLCERGDVDAVATVGAVITGDTGHDEVVVDVAADKCADLALEHDTPVALGVIGPDVSADEARARTGYARRSVESAVAMAERYGD